MLHFVKVLVTFVSWMRKPTVGAGTSNPSAVPVVKALKNFISPFVTTSPPPGNVCRVPLWCPRNHQWTQAFRPK